MSLQGVSIHAVHRFQERIAPVSFAVARCEIERILAISDPGQGPEGRYVEGVFQDVPYRLVLDQRGFAITTLGVRQYQRPKSKSTPKIRSKQVRKYGPRVKKR